MKSPRKPPASIRTVNLLWYPLALIPIIGLGALALVGWLPLFVLPIALFLMFFWIFSLGFAVYAKLRTHRNLRQ